MTRPHSILRAFAAAAIVGPVLACSVGASISPATAAVYSPQQALPAATIQQFLANPSSLLTQYPDGGPAMIKEVRDLAASDPQTVNALIGLLTNATPDQASAIGTGLGQYAELTVNSDPTLATQIQSDIVGAHNNPALVAFSAVVGGDIQLAAATGGVGGGGAGEAPTGSNTPSGGIANPVPLNFPSSVANQAQSFPNVGLSVASSVSQSVP